MEESIWLNISSNIGQGLRHAQFAYMAASSALTAIIVFGDQASYQFPITVIAIGNMLYGVLAVSSGFQASKELGNVMPASLASSSFGVAWKKTPTGLFNALNAIICVLIAVSQISVTY
jgi:hypothetical protein